jgi:hypothetical protein
MEIKKYEEYNRGLEMAKIFFESLDEKNPNDQDKYKKIQDSEIKKLKSAVKSDIHFNFGLIVSFGAGIGALYGIVDSLISMETPKIDTRTVVLMTMAGIYMIVQGEVKNAKERKQILEETKVILSELQLAGYPNATTGTKEGSDNPILNKVVKILKSIKKIFTAIKSKIESYGFDKLLKRASINTISGFADMFAYTAMLVPVMNSINALLGYMKMNIDSFLANTSVFIIGIMTIIAKHGANYFMVKMKNFFNLNNDEKTEIEKEIEDNYNLINIDKKPSIKNLSDMDIDGHEIIQEKDDDILLFTDFIKK